MKIKAKTCLTHASNSTEQHLTAMLHMSSRPLFYHCEVTAVNMQYAIAKYINQEYEHTFARISGVGWEAATVGSLLAVTPPSVRILSPDCCRISRRKIALPSISTHVDKMWTDRADDMTLSGKVFIVAYLSASSNVSGVYKLAVPLRS